MYTKSLEEFWKEMEVCTGQRSDGKDGQCIDLDRHNHGCWGCAVANGLYEPPVFTSYSGL